MIGGDADGVTFFAALHRKVHNGRRLSTIIPDHAPVDLPLFSDVARIRGHPKSENTDSGHDAR
jgi:hypothetical protein